MTEQRDPIDDRECNNGQSDMSLSDMTDEEIKQRALAADTKLQRHARLRLEDALSLGEFLNELRARLTARGEYKGWVEQNLAVCNRMEQKYRRLAKNKSVIEAAIENGELSSPYRLSEALRLIGQSKNMEKAEELPSAHPEQTGKKKLDKCDTVELIQYIDLRLQAQGVNDFHHILQDIVNQLTER